MADLRKLLDILNESSTTAGSVATVAAGLSGTHKRVEEDKPEAPSVLEYGNWENSALTTSSKLKKERKKASKVVKSIYGEDSVEEAANSKQQAAIAIAKKKEVGEGKNKKQSVVVEYARAPIKNRENYLRQRKAIQDLQMQGSSRDKEKIMRMRAELDNEAKKLGIKLGEDGIEEGKFTVNAKTGAKLDPRTGAELPPKEKPLTMKDMFRQPKSTAPKLSLDDVWRKVEDVVGRIFPDGDPIDHLAPWLEKHGIRDFKIGEILDRAAKKNGYKDLYDYYDSMKNQYTRDNMAEGSDELYQKAIRKYTLRVAHDYLGGGNEHVYGANKFDSEMFGVDPKQSKQDFDRLFPEFVKKLQGGEQGVAEGSGDKVHLKTPKHGLADHPGRDTGVGLRTFAQTPEKDRCPKCNSLFKNHYKQGVAEAKSPEEFINQLKSLDKKQPRVTHTCEKCGKKWQLQHHCKGAPDKKEQGVAEGSEQKMSVQNTLAYLKKVMGTESHEDWRNHIINTNEYFVLKDIPVNSLRSDLSGLDKANVEKYKQMDFSKAPPIVIGSDGNILDGYHRVNVAKALKVPTLKAWVGVKKKGVAEGYDDDDEGNPVMNAIINRIMRTRPDLLLNNDLDKLQAAIRDVATGVGDVDEIGSSDISGWVKQVEQNLQQGVAEAAKWRRDDLEGKTWRSPDWDDGDLSPSKIKIDRSGRDVDDSDDELTSRPGSWRGKADMAKRMTKKGVPTKSELGFQDNLKMRMRMKKKEGGLTGPKGVLPEQGVEEGLLGTALDKAKSVGKKVLDVVAPDDEELLRQLQRSMGIPASSQHGKKSMAEPVDSKLDEADLIINPASMPKRSLGLLNKPEHPDHEVEMAKSDLYQASKNALAVFQLIKDIPEEVGIEGWVQEKIIKANDYLNTVREYLEGKQLESMDGVAPSTKMFTSEDSVEEGKTGPGLWANIHAKRKRIKAGSGERMRKPGSKGAPKASDFRAARGGE